MTVNHDVTGSSPVRGAKTKPPRRVVFVLASESGSDGDIILNAICSPAGRSEVVASLKQLRVVLSEAKPPRCEASASKEQSEPSVAGDGVRLCDGGEMCA